MQAERGTSRAGQRNQLVISQLRGVRLISPGVMSERRTPSERRRQSLWSVLYGGFRPRRRTVRRMNDDSLPLVDWHEAHLLAVAIGILLLCCADAFLTLNLLVLGAHEANPFMARLIYTDVTAFAAVKMGLTGCGVMVLVLLARYRLFGRVRVVTALYLSLLAYTLLVLYELTLLLTLG